MLRLFFFYQSLKLNAGTTTSAPVFLFWPGGTVGQIIHELNDNIDY